MRCSFGGVFFDLLFQKLQDTMRILHRWVSFWLAITAIGIDLILVFPGIRFIRIGIFGFVPAIEQACFLVEGKTGIYQGCGIGIMQHIFMEPEIMFQNVANYSVYEGDIGCGPNMHMMIAGRAGSCETRIDMAGYGALFPGLHWPVKATGCASAMFDPMMIMQSLLTRSRGGLVQAPKPNVGDRAATVVEWQ